MSVISTTGLVKTRLTKAVCSACKTRPVEFLLESGYDAEGDFPLKDYYCSLCAGNKESLAHKVEEARLNELAKKYNKGVSELTHDEMTVDTDTVVVVTVTTVETKPETDLLGGGL